MKRELTASQATRRKPHVMPREEKATGAAFFFFLTYLVLAIVRPHEFGANPTTFPIIPIVEVLAAIAWLGVEKRLDMRPYSFLFIFALVIFLSLARHSLAIAASKTGEFLSTVVFITVILPAVVNSTSRAITTLKFIVFCGVFISVHTLDQHFSADKTGFTGQTALYRVDSGGAWQVRYIGIFGDPNDLGLLLVAMLPLALWLRSQATGFFSRRYFEIAFLINLVAIFLTNSRGTWLALAATASLWIALKSGVTRVAVFLSISVPLALAFGPSRLSGGQDESSSDRIDAWYQGFQMFQNYPLLGVGKDLFRDHHEKTAHNSWVLTLAETGMFGYLAWTGFMFFCVSCGATFIHREKIVTNFKSETTLNQLIAVVFLSLVAVLVSMVFLSRAYVLTPYLFCGLFLALREVAKRGDNPESLQGSMAFTFIPAIAMIVVVYVAIRAFGV